MDRIYRRTMLFGRLFHSWSNVAWSCGRFVGWLGRARARLSNSSQMCSIGERSGDIDGHSITFTLFAVKNCVVARAVWGRALSCCSIVTPLPVYMNGKTTGARMSSLYFWALRVPFTVTSWVFPLCEIPPKYHHRTAPKTICLNNACVSVTTENTRLSIKKNATHLYTESVATELHSTTDDSGTRSDVLAMASR